MLQWMGGSRRKVTTSRKSTHKRQKQYFEQRNRQQQQHTAGFESYADGRGSCVGNNRSLDILNLINISTAAQELKASCINGDKPEDYDFTLNHQYSLPYHAILDDEALLADQAEINVQSTVPCVSGTSSSYGTEAEYPEKVSIHLPDHNEDIARNGCKVDPFKFPTALSVSVIDLLNDSGADTNAEEHIAHAQEAHVAFSIEGLGEVETETPLRSPKIPGRSFPNDFSLRQKARGQPLTFKHMDYGFHDLRAQVDLAVQDIEFPPYYGSIEQTFRSKDINSIGDRNLMFSNCRYSFPFNWDGSNSQVAVDNDELIYNIRHSGKNIWDGLRVSNDSIDVLGDNETFADHQNVPHDDYLHNKEIWKQGFSFDGWNLQKTRFGTKRTENFDLRVSPVSYRKHQTTEDPSDKISNTRCSTIRINNDVKDAVNRFAREDKRQSLSLLSEESCSSTAVRGDATRKS